MLRAIVLGGTAILILGMVVLNVGLCFSLQQSYERIPERFRMMDPGFVWLLMVPCSGVLRLFSVLPRLSRSFKACFDAAEQRDVGDCGLGLAKGVAACALCALIPCVGGRSAS